jgi:hypothetical protein
MDDPIDIERYLSKKDPNYGDRALNSNTSTKALSKLSALSPYLRDSYADADDCARSLLKRGSPLSANRRGLWIEVAMARRGRRSFLSRRERNSMCADRMRFLRFDPS